MTEQLLGDTRVWSGVNEQTARPMPHVMKAHRRQASPKQQGLEVLGEPRAIDRQTVLRDEHERVPKGHDGPLGILSCEMRPQAVKDEGRQRDGPLRGRGLRLDKNSLPPRARDLVSDRDGHVDEVEVRAGQPKDF